MSLPSDRSGDNFQGARMQSPLRTISPGGDDASEEESLRNVFRILRKRRYSVFAWTLGTVALAFLLCALMKNKYTSTATLLVDQQNSSGLGAESLSGLASAIGGGSDLKTDLQTHSDVLQSDTTTLASRGNTGFSK